MEFLGGIRFQDMKLQEMHNLLISQRQLTKGLTVIVDVDHLDSDINSWLRNISTHVHYICLTSNRMKYSEMIPYFSSTSHVLLYNTQARYKRYNQALELVMTTHVMFMDATEQLVYHGENLSAQTVILPSRASHNGEDVYFNSVFQENSEESKVNLMEEVQIAEAPSKKEKDELHPYAIIIQEEVIANLPKPEQKRNKYPIQLVLERLYAFNGIIFPLEQLLNFTFEQVDTEYQFMTKFLSSTDVQLQYQPSILFRANTSAMTEDDLSAEQTLSRIEFLAQLMTIRTNSNVAKFLQYLADKELLKIGNLIDKEQLARTVILNRLEHDKLNLSVLNRGRAKELVIAYCFPPYNDTSGNVMAKRIFVEDECVDVIYNRMDRIRSKDTSLMQMTNHLVDTMFELSAPQAFSSWGSIEEFMAQGIQIYSEYQHKYSRLYSRAMFPASHFLAFEIKHMSPDIHWRAEFSDPLHTDVSSHIRFSPIDDEAYVKRVKELLPIEYRELADDNVFNLCELLPLAFAEELIFTNEHQLEYMIDRFSPEIQSSIRKRAKTVPHPTLPQSFYELQTSFYTVDESKINLAYFGNFYDTRGFREIELVAKYLENSGINNFEIHIFTNLNPKVVQFYDNSAYKSYMTMNPYVMYFEFLNLTNKMDGLMIFDAHTKEIKEMNPYLPSKLSDYLGSKAYTLAFVEAGSILSKQRHNKLLKVDMIHFTEYPEMIRNLSEKVGKKLVVLNEYE